MWRHLIWISVFWVNTSVHAASFDLIDEAIRSLKNTAPITVSDLSAEAQQATLISFGETHSRGTEKEVLEEIMTEVFKSLPESSVCGVETVSGNSVPPYTIVKSHAPIEQLFNDHCSSFSAVSNNSVVNTSFTDFLKLAGSNDSRHITYSGLRHILPWSKHFPEYFGNALIDVKSKSTIVDQVPEKFGSSNTTLTISVVSQEHLYLNLVKSVFRKSLGQSKKKIDSNLRGLYKKIEDLGQVAEFNFVANEKYKIIRLSAIERQNEKHYLVVYSENNQFNERTLRLVEHIRETEFISSFKKDSLFNDDYISMSKKTPKSQILSSLVVKDGKMTIGNAITRELREDSIVYIGLTPGKPTKFIYVDENLQPGSL